MAIVVKCLGSASGAAMGVEGQYLKAFDLEAHDGQGFVDFTTDLRAAQRFADVGEFHRHYRTSPACRPYRDDGQPNRPLTATHWELIGVDS